MFAASRAVLCSLLLFGIHFNILMVLWEPPLLSFFVCAAAGGMLQRMNEQDMTKNE
jgi:hypothetical protein